MGLCRSFIPVLVPVNAPVYVRRAELAARGAEIARRLHGYWSGEHGMCLCPAHHDQSPSLSIRVGDRALLFKCFAGCATADVLWSVRRLDSRALRLRATQPAAPGREEWTRARAHEIWDEAGTLRGTPAQDYLASRGIRILSPALRYHPRVPLKRHGRLIFRPAMLGVVRDAKGIVALQRTFLDLERRRLAADLGRARRILAHAGNGAVRLASAAHILGLAEGIETALSATQILGIPVWATLGAERLPRIAIPPWVRHLLVLPDNDPAGLAAEPRAMLSYTRAGLTTETLLPPERFKDWNDVIRGKGSPRDAISWRHQSLITSCRADLEGRGEGVGRRRCVGSGAARGDAALRRP